MAMGSLVFGIVGRKLLVERGSCNRNLCVGGNGKGKGEGEGKGKGEGQGGGTDKKLADRQRAADKDKRGLRYPQLRQAP